LGYNAGSDFRYRNGAKVQADGCEHAVKFFRGGYPGVDKIFANEGYLATAAYHADIGGGGVNAGLEDLLVVLVLAGNYHNKGVGGRGEFADEGGDVAAMGLDAAGKQVGMGEFGTVIDDHDLEIYPLSLPGQGLADVPAATD
jgi:hypothetical protein